MAATERPLALQRLSNIARETKSQTRIEQVRGSFFIGSVQRDSLIKVEKPKNN